MEQIKTYLIENKDNFAKLHIIEVYIKTPCSRSQAYYSDNECECECFNDSSYICTCEEILQPDYGICDIFFLLDECLPELHTKYHSQYHKHIRILEDKLHCDNTGYSNISFFNSSIKSLGYELFLSCT